MTIPYNASSLSMIKYVQASLHLLEDNCSDSVAWYSKSDKGLKPIINSKDIVVLVKSIAYIINNDFVKIKKLQKYLKNVATVLTLLGLPIVWSLPHGLIVKQSYLEVESTSIRPFVYKDTKINIQVVNKDKYDKLKQVRALMPNLIHSLDATSLSLLYDKFSNVYKDSQFLSIHDCFATTVDKVATLKTMLSSVYMELYSNDPYLDQFDKYLLNYIEKTGRVLDRNTRTVEIIINNRVKYYELIDIEWVKNKKDINKRTIERIDSQHILV